ncbi:MAG: hypothetical protein OXG08_04615 [Gammaproteobacteria bacterium]|nr:hypothetical protein [Gammaproteobacteria bacterium]
MKMYKVTLSKPRGSKLVMADSIEGHEMDQDSYIFKNGEEIVAIYRKMDVVSVVKQGDVSTDNDQ